LLVKKMLNDKKTNREKAKIVLYSMEDPYLKLVQVIKTI
jgi:hypothetical protein